MKHELWRKPDAGVYMRQGYVATKDGTTVRVRIAGDRAYLTLKDHSACIVLRASCGVHRTSCGEIG